MPRAGRDGLSAHGRYCDVALGRICADLSESRCDRHDVRELVLFLALGRELDLAVDQREQRVVLAHADVHARMDLRAALADDDAAGADGLAAVRP